MRELNVEVGGEPGRGRRPNYDHPRLRLRQTLIDRYSNNFQLILDEIHDDDLGGSRTGRRVKTTKSNLVDGKTMQLLSLLLNVLSADLCVGSSYDWTPYYSAYICMHACVRVLLPLQHLSKCNNVYQLESLSSGLK